MLRIHDKAEDIISATEFVMLKNKYQYDINNFNTRIDEINKEINELKEKENIAESERSILEKYTQQGIKHLDKLDRFTLAYAISIHKSQGSEYDNVVIVLAKSFKRMFYNKLIYTAVTRAKQSLIILGSLESFNSSVQTLYADNRNTYLKHV